MLEVGEVQRAAEAYQQQARQLQVSPSEGRVTEVLRCAQTTNVGVRILILALTTFSNDDHSCAIARFLP